MTQCGCSNGKPVMTPCDCPECSRYGGPTPALINARLAAFFAQVGVGSVGLVMQKRWKALGVFLGNLGFFVVVMRYFICAKCANYGNDCHSLRIGKLTEKMYEYRPGEFSPVAVALEAISLFAAAFAPMVALRRNSRAWLLYSLLNGILLVTQFFHACRHCAKYSHPDWGWRYRCPSAQLYRTVFGIKARDI